MKLNIKFSNKILRIEKQMFCIRIENFEYTHPLTCCFLLKLKEKRKKEKNRRAICCTTRGRWGGGRVWTGKWGVKWKKRGTRKYIVQSATASNDLIFLSRKTSFENCIWFVLIISFEEPLSFHFRNYSLKYCCTLCSIYYPSLFPSNSRPNTWPLRLNLFVENVRLPAVFSRCAFVGLLFRDSSCRAGALKCGACTAQTLARALT